MFARKVLEVLPLIVALGVIVLIIACIITIGEG